MNEYCKRAKKAGSILEEPLSCHETWDDHPRVSDPSNPKTAAGFVSDPVQLELELRELGVSLVQAKERLAMIESSLAKLRVDGRERTLLRINYAADRQVRTRGIPILRTSAMRTDRARAACLPAVAICTERACSRVPD